mmetsp:Transcript_7762/g.17705  ORF Transcript_7762/g.17705 Transcript_7762/m.17705 type:complete len:200 (-) Transcript_7762:698-1297(-)
MPTAGCAVSNATDRIWCKRRYARNVDRAVFPLASLAISSLAVYDHTLLPKPPLLKTFRRLHDEEVHSIPRHGEHVREVERLDVRLPEEQTWRHLAHFVAKCCDTPRRQRSPAENARLHFPNPICGVVDHDARFRGIEVRLAESVDARYRFYGGGVDEFRQACVQSPGRAPRWRPVAQRSVCFPHLSIPRLSLAVDSKSI